MQKVLSRCYVGNVGVKYCIQESILIFFHSFFAQQERGEGRRERRGGKREKRGEEEEEREGEERRGEGRGWQQNYNQ